MHKFGDIEKFLQFVKKCWWKQKALFHRNIAAFARIFTQILLLLVGLVILDQRSFAYEFS